MAKRKRDEAPSNSNRNGIVLETLNTITNALEAKGLDLESVPAEFAEIQGLKSRDLADLTESKGQALLSWLEGIPDDQMAEPDNADTLSVNFMAPNGLYANADSDNDSGNGEGKEEIRKAEDVITVKRPLTSEECQSALDDLYELESRCTCLELELEGFRGKVKACQKEIESIDTETYRIIRDIKANEVEEEVEALRITNHTTGMITWYDRNTGEALKERAINSGEQLPLDLAGEAADHGADAEPETVKFHGKLEEKTETGIRFAVRYSDKFGVDDLEFEIPHDQIISTWTGILADELDSIIITRAYAAEAGIMADPEEVAPADDPEAGGGREEKSCSVCLHGQIPLDPTCKGCWHDVDDEHLNFAPIPANDPNHESLVQPEEGIV